MNPITLLIVSAALAMGAKPQANDPVIGHVLGEPVHASQIQGANQAERADSLRNAVVSPAIKAYLEPHRSEWSLSEDEIASITRSYKALVSCKPELNLQPMEPPFDRIFAAMVGGGTKIQRFIYLNHGGGRLLFQQAGMEAFDATRTLVLQLEREGKFGLSDPRDRELALRYWTRENQTLLDDPGPDEAFKLDSVIDECPGG
ncbi:hypothetical protein [Lysobacter sp. F6437]|uniref:hypothetical protein n=1 Tax=Lysobacter sp. F6437 TaxID=3459296 RepID=UPI00403DCC97